MAKIKNKKGDKVIVVVAGKNKGATGEVLKIYPEKNRAMVRGVNIVKNILNQLKMIQEV